MAKSDGIGTTVGIKGDKAYRQALSDMGRQLRVLNTDMKASQSAFGDQATTMDGLGNKMEALLPIYDLQRQKVKLLSDKLEEMEAAGKGNSEAADNLRIDLNNATAAMNKTGNEIKATGQGLETLQAAAAASGDEQSAMTMTLKEAEAALQETEKASDGAGDAIQEEGEKAQDSEGKNSRLKEALAGLGSVAGGALKLGVEAAAASMAALATAAGAALAASFEFSKGAGKYADDVATLSAQTGISTQSLQQWTYASNFVDTSVDTITGSMTRMVKNMGDAADGSKSAQEKFSALGVSVLDASGNMRDGESVFWDAMEALKAIENPTQRDALAMDLFGKSARELNPLIEAGAEAWREMGKEASLMGTVFSEENLNKMGAFDDSMQKFTATGDALKNSIGLVMIPAFQPLVDAASASMGRVAYALQDGLHPGELEWLVGYLVDTAKSGLNEIGTLVTQALPVVQQALTQVVGSLANALPGMVSTLLPGALGLLTGVVDALASNVEPLTRMAADMAVQLAEFFADNAPVLMEAVVSMVSGLADGIIDALPQLIPAGVEMAVKLAAGLIKGIPKLIAKLPEIVGAVWNGLVQTDWAALGGEILAAIGEGLGTLGETLGGLFAEGIALVSDLDFGGIFDAVKNAIGGIAGWFVGLFGIGVDAAAGLDFGAIGTAVQHALGSIGSWFSGLFAKGKRLAEEMDWQSLGDSIGTGLKAGVGLAAELFSGAMTGAYALVRDLDWPLLGTTIASVANGLIDLTGEALSGAFTAGHTIIKEINWVGLGEALTAVPNGLISVSGELLAAPFTTAAEAISGIQWASIGDDIANGLNRAWGIVSDLGSAALGVGEIVAGGANMAVHGLKDLLNIRTGSEQAAEQEARRMASAISAGLATASPSPLVTAGEMASGIQAALTGQLTAEAGNAIGSTFGGAVGDGIRTEQVNVGQMALGLALAVRLAMQNMLSAAAGASIGIAYAGSLGAGIRNGGTRAAAAASEVAAQAVAALRQATSTFAGLGADMARGLARGLRESSSIVSEAARQVARTAYNSAKEELGIRSPSRKFGYLGEMSISGWVQSIQEGEAEVQAAMARLYELTGSAPSAYNGSAAGQSGAPIDYDRLGQAVASAMAGTGLGNSQIILDGRMVGETVEPYASRATYQRTQRSIRGRMARLVSM